MKKILSMLLSLALCLCLLEIHEGNLPKWNDSPNMPGFSTVDQENPEEPGLSINNDAGPGERNENT